MRRRARYSNRRVSTVIFRIHTLIWGIRRGVGRLVIPTQIYLYYIHVYGAARVTSTGTLSSSLQAGTTELHLRFEFRAAIIHYGMYGEG